MKKLITCFLKAYIFILTYSCQGGSSVDEKMEYCITPNNLNIEIAHELTNSNEMVKHRIKYHYFTNGKADHFNKEFFYARTGVLNANMRHTNRKFLVEDVVIYDQTPEHYERALKVIEGLEYLEPRNDLRNRFIIEHFAFWGKVFESKNAIDIFVYDNVSGGFAGVALAIQSKTIAVRWDYIDPIYTLDTDNVHKTLEHEIGHALGLKHTHHEEKGDPPNDTGLNDKFGDRICDTPKAPKDLYKYMRDDGSVRVGAFPDNIANECIENSTKNYMSYIEGKFRMKFTDGQIAEMNRALETNRDLRATCTTFDYDEVVNLPEKIEL